MKMGLFIFLVLPSTYLDNFASRYFPRSDGEYLVAWHCVLTRYLINGPVT